MNYIYNINIMAFVFDRFYNSIQWIDDNELKHNKLRYKIINSKKLNDLESKNYTKIKHIIKENGENKLYHLSTKPLSQLLDTSLKGTTYIGKTNLYYHPVGLYMSCGMKYFTEGLLHYSYVYEIQLNPSVLKINTIKEFINFIMKYKHNDKTIKIYDILNWKKIKKQYDGICICNNFRAKIFGNTKDMLSEYGNDNIDNEKNLMTIYNKVNNIPVEKQNDWKNDIYFLSEWYRNWGSESVVWRPSGIKLIRLIEKTNTFDVLA